MPNWPKKLNNVHWMRGDEQAWVDETEVIPAKAGRELALMLDTILYYEMGAAERRRDDAVAVLARYHETVRNEGPDS